jgi:hypothetical protein
MRSLPIAPERPLSERNLRAVLARAIAASATVAPATAQSVPSAPELAIVQPRMPAKLFLIALPGTGHCSPSPRRFGPEWIMTNIRV